MAESAFLRLPLEIRLSIYQYCLRDGCTMIEFSGNHFERRKLNYLEKYRNRDTCPYCSTVWFFRIRGSGSNGACPHCSISVSLRATCQQMYDEIPEFLVQKTVLRFQPNSKGLHDRNRLPCDLKAWHAISKWHTDRIRHLHLLQRPYWELLLPLEKLQKRFPRLETLTLTAKPMDIRERKYLTYEETVLNSFIPAGPNAGKYAARIEGYIVDVRDSALLYFGTSRNRRLRLEIICDVQAFCTTCPDTIHSHDDGVAGSIWVGLAPKFTQVLQADKQKEARFLELDRHNVRRPNVWVHTIEWTPEFQHFLAHLKSHGCSGKTISTPVFGAVRR